MDWIFPLALGMIVTLGVAFIQWRRLAAARAEQKKLQDQLMSLEGSKVGLQSENASLHLEKTTLADHLAALKKERAALKTMLEGPPEAIGIKSKLGLRSYCYAMQLDLRDQVALLKQSPVHSQATYWVEEVERIRVVDRKARFERYRDALVQVKGNIDAAVRVLEANDASVGEFISLIDSNKLDFSFGSLEAVALERVLADLKDEAARDLLERRLRNSIEAEFENLMELKEALEKAAKRDREIPNPKRAGSARELDDD